MSSLSKTHFKDSYTNVSNLGGTHCFFRRGGGRVFASCSNPNEVLSSNVNHAKDQAPLLLHQVTAGSIHTAPNSRSEPVAAPPVGGSPVSIAAQPTPHKCTSFLCGGPGAGLPLFNLFKKKNVLKSFCAPIEREHELFFNSSHFDILLYLNRFVI